MKPFGLAVVLSFFLTGLLISQDTDKINLEPKNDKLYLRFGFNHSYRSSSSFEFIAGSGFRRGSNVFAKGWGDVLMAGLGYEYSEMLYFDLMYEYMNGISYTSAELWKTTMTGRYYRHVTSTYKAHELTLRANYFVNSNRKDNPIYFIGGVTFSSQPVKNRFIDEDENETVVTEQSLRRNVAGPMAGIGVFWETGFLSFMTELTIGSKFSIGKKSAAETSINLSISPIMRLKDF